MLSKKSKTFIENLRMYLMTSGKNMDEIEQLIDELSIHLYESEKAGRNIEQIIGFTPEQYMKSLEKEMKTDYVMIMKLAPILLIGIAAYFLIGPAIRNEFSLNIVQIVGFPVVALISFLIHIIFLRQAGKKQYSLKRFFLVGMISSIATMLLFILLLSVSRLLIEPVFVATKTENIIVIGVCILIFVILALWSKTITPIWIPTFLVIPDILFRYNVLSMEKILYVQVLVIVLLFVIIILSLFLTERSKKVKD